MGRGVESWVSVLGSWAWPWVLDLGSVCFGVGFGFGLGFGFGDNLIMYSSGHVPRESLRY